MLLNIEVVSDPIEEKDIENQSFLNNSNMKIIMSDVIERSKLARQRYNEGLGLLDKLDNIEAQIAIAEETLEAHINNSNSINIEELKFQVEAQVNYLNELNAELSQWDIQESQESQESNEKDHATYIAELNETFKNSGVSKDEDINIFFKREFPGLLCPGGVNKFSNEKFNRLLESLKKKANCSQVAEELLKGFEHKFSESQQEQLDSLVLPY